MAAVTVQQPPFNTCTCELPTASPRTPFDDTLYQPLPGPDSVRLLEIIPGPRHSGLACRLFLSNLSQISLSPPPSYEAISYVWGVSAALTTIQCNGHGVRVTSSLASALARFRSPRTSRVVWIDGICINQADDREKGHQVKLMRFIYKRARRVLVWLGEAAHHRQPQAAFSAICALANQTLPLDAPASALATWGFDDDDDEDEEQSGKERSSKSPGRKSSSSGSGRKNLLADRWEALGPFYALPWFHRVWVIQEIALSTTASMHWGPGGAHISWAHVARATDRIIELKNRLPLHRLPGMLHAHLMGSLWQAEQRRAMTKAVEKDRMPFEELFARTTKFEVTDPRDRVYGLLGIPTREADPDAGELYLEPDYGVNLVGLYVRLFQKQGLRMRDLGPLS
ncbi:hypothetical protein SLS57_009359 [Botryosphaeria dothidea]